MWWSHMDTDRKNQIRRRSMFGTSLFVVGIIAVIASVVTQLFWLGVAGVVIVLPGAVMLYQVGKSLPR
jgi:membrane-bound ClpP family serine protease